MLPFGVLRAIQRAKSIGWGAPVAARSGRVKVATILVALATGVLPGASPVAAAADFQLTIEPRTAFLAPNGTLHLTVGGAALEGFSSPLTLTALDLPAGVTASFSPNPLVLPGTSDLTLTAGPGLVVDDFNVNVAATGGGITHFAIGTEATLDFDLAREPAPPCQGSVEGFLRNSRTGVGIASTAFSGSFLGTTDSTGHYGPFDWPTGTYDLTAEVRPGYWPVQKSVTIACGPTTHLDFDLLPWDPATVVGTVIEGTPTGPMATTVVPSDPASPIAGAIVQVDGIGPPSGPSAVDGSYLIALPFLGDLNTPVQNARLHASNPGYWPRGTSTPSPLPIGDLQLGPNGPFTVPLVRQCTQDANGTTTRISGTVTYGDTGHPAAGVRVVAPHTYKSQSATTLADGTYVIDRVLLGYNEIPTDYTVSASLPLGHPREWYYESKDGPAHIDACGDRRQVNLVLPAIPMGSIEGFVIDDDGNKVPNAQIGIAQIGCRPCITTDAKSDATGHYRIFDIPAPSTWGIKYFDQFGTPFWESDAESVDVAAGQATRHDVDIVRKRHATVRGTVQDAITGSAIAGASIAAADEAATISEADGSYLLPPLLVRGPDNSPRNTKLFYAADGYWPLEAPITLEKDQTYTRDVDLIPVCRGVTVTGVVRDALTGLPIPFARVVTDHGVGVDADEQGRYRLENLDVGSQNSPTELLITAFKQDYVAQERSVEIFCGAKVAVGNPASIVIRKVTDPPGDPASFSFTGALGSFSLTDGQSRTSAGLFPGTFVLQETVPAGWVLGDVTCGDQSLDIDDGHVAIDVAAGENLTCTFTNQRLGTVVIRKTTIPSGDATRFDFSGPIDDFTLADGQSHTINDVPPGEHSVFEGPAEPWEITNAACDDDDSGPTEPEFGFGEITVRLAANETVICTFTNQRQPTGTIVIRKQTDPKDSSAIFTFSGPEDDFDLSDGESHTISGIRTGEFRFFEEVPDGWVLDNVECDDDDSGAADPEDPNSLTVNLAADEVVTCTYFDRAIPPESGTLIVEKTTEPADNPTPFPFSSEILGDFSVAGGATRTFELLTPGTYAVSEGSVVGWELETATCDDGSAVDAIEIESGETVTCSFHNVQVAATGSIVIEKETRPGGDATSFAFTGDLGAFGLADGESKTVAGLAVGTYVVAETAIDGWDTLSSCDDGSPVTAIDVAADEVVTCTFTNTKRPTLRIVKETDPATDPQDFAFTTVGSGLEVFSLDTDAADGTLSASRSFVLLAGAYTVTETLPVTGWDFSRVSCASADGTSTVPQPSTTSSSVTVTLAVGDTVACTYRNAKRARFEVVKTVSGLAPTGAQTFDFEVRRDASPTNQGTTIGTGRANAANGGRLTIASVADPTKPLVVVAGTYQFCEFVLPAWGNPLGVSSFVPGIANDSTIDNAYQCVGVTVIAGDTRTFALDNRPPPGGQAKTIGFWKNWASCASSKGKQRPILDAALAAVPGGIQVGTISVTTCQVAVDLLSKSTIGDPATVGDGKKSASDPAFNFAAQYVAFRLNGATGAGSCSAATVAASTGQAILASITFDGRNHAKISKADVVRLNDAATMLDRYNNNTLPC